MDNLINGIDVERLAATTTNVTQDPELAVFRFKTRTMWLDGGNSQTTITSLYGAGREWDGRNFTLQADEPQVLLGRDRAPNPVEHLLNALGCCITASMVYHAAARGIEIEACECELRGELDARGFLGTAPGVRRGYKKIEAHFRVKSDAPPKVLEECARQSPVLDVVSNGTEVELTIEPEETWASPQAEYEPSPASP